MEFLDAVPDKASWLVWAEPYWMIQMREAKIKGTIYRYNRPGQNPSDNVPLDKECEHLWEAYSPNPGFVPACARCVKCGLKNSEPINYGNRS